MTVLFNGSPVLRFPGPDGQPKTVVFAMPAGFSWELDDLKAAFAVMKTGKLEILTEEQAREELAPQQVTLKVAVKTAGALTGERMGKAEVQINGTPTFVISAPAAGKSPAQRAQAAQAALTKWAAAPIHPSQLSLLLVSEKEASLRANDQELIRVTAADVKAAAAEGTRQLANTWLKGIKEAVAGAVQQARQTPATKAPTR
jgi:hypothetical protein